MQHRFYFPLRLDDAVAVLRRERRLDQVVDNSHHVLIVYTDRQHAVASYQEVKGEKCEVCLVVVECDEPILLELLHGDFTHFGPTARRLSPHAMELESVAQERLSHEGRLSLEIVKG